MAVKLRTFSRFYSAVFSWLFLLVTVLSVVTEDCGDSSNGNDLFLLVDDVLLSA